MNFSEETRKFIINNFERKNFNDKDFFHKFMKFLVKDNALEDYIKDLYVDDLSKSRCVGLYDTDKKVVIVDLDMLKDAVLGLKKYLSKIDFDKLFRFYFFSNIIHEFTHVYQQKMISNENDKSALVEMIRDSYLFSRGHLNLDADEEVSYIEQIVGSNTCSMFNNLFCLERHAEVTAVGFMYDVYKEKYSDDIEAIGDLKYFYKSLLMDEYGDNTCAVQGFYDVINHSNKFKTLDFSSYDNITKVKFGMPISKKEVKKVVDILLK